jgi:hypothetical protein
MAKNLITDWDTTSANNTDIAGVNLAEGCPAAGINDAIRTVMSQIATWLAAAGGPLLKTGGAVTGAITGMLNASTVLDGAGVSRFVGYRAIPLTAKTAAYQIALTDVGQGVASTTGGWTVPANATTAFAIGDTVLLYNNSASNQTITQAVGVTLRLVGTATTGNRTLAQRGVCTLLKVGSDEWVASGGGVS